MLRYTLSEGNSGTNPVGFTIELRQGLGGTLIASTTHAQGTIPTTFTLFQLSLSESEADTITDYSDLTVTMLATCDTGCGNSPTAREEVLVSWVEFAIVEGVSPPTLNAVNVVNSTALNPVWTEPLDLSDVQGYEIQRDSGSGFVGILNVTNGTTSHIDGNLIPDTLYRYQILTLGSTEKSIPSNILNATTGDVVLTEKISRPDNDPDLRWVNAVGCSALQTHECVDEVTRNDSDYVETVGLSSSNSDTQFYEMSDISDPFQSEGHVLRYTLMEAGDGTNQPRLTVTLRQGVSTIATFVHEQGSIPSSFQIFEQVLTTSQADLITDYSLLELTLLADCPTGCQNGAQNIERLRVSWIEFEVESLFAPELFSVDTVNATSLRVLWELPNQDDTDQVLIQRTNATNFVTIGNVSKTETSFDDVDLPNQKSFKYRIQTKLTNGQFSQTSNEITGTTPPDSTTLNTQGSTIEPNATNTFTNSESGIIAQTIELFNIDTNTMASIITDIDSQKLNTFQIIDKMNNGSYDASLKTRNAGAFYGNVYLELGDIDQFISDIISRVRTLVND